MYSMKPYHEFSSEILLPRCMYNLEPICDVKLLQEDAAASAVSCYNFSSVVACEANFLSNFFISFVSNSL